MSQYVYAPGRDSEPTTQDPDVSYNPRRASGAAGGVYAEFMQGATPKYAINRGLRETQMRDTMARMFIRVDQDEYESLFLPSIGDTHVRTNLAQRIAGDPTNPRLRGRTVLDTGYLDFLLQNVQHSLQEKYQVSETLSDNYVAFFFGQTAPVWQYSGVLINSVQDDQASNMLRLYLHLLRGTQLARRQKTVSLKYDSLIVAGAITNFTWSLQAQNELLVPFSFQLLVKKILITNYTSGWKPTLAGGVFAADPNAVPYDGRPRAERLIHATVVRQPSGTEETPGPNRQADARVSQAASSTTDAFLNTVLTPPVSAPSTTDFVDSLLGPAIVTRPPTASAPTVSDRPETLASGLDNNPDVRGSRPASGSGPLLVSLPE